jgi:hypothetical protein
MGITWPCNILLGEVGYWSDFEGWGFNLSIIPFQPQELPYNTVLRPFPGEPSGYLHPHVNILRVYCLRYPAVDSSPVGKCPATPHEDYAHASSFSSSTSFNSFTSNCFHTLLPDGAHTTLFLSIVSAVFLSQRGCTPLALFSSTASSPISSISRRPSHFSSTAYKMLLPQPLCFDNHPFSWGEGGQ